MARDIASAFAQSYAEARTLFMAAAEAAGLDVQSHRHPLLGHDGETLAMDVARCGRADAPAVLVLSSACHGVEGFCGSGVQVALLGEPAFHAEARRAGVALLYVHALNPHGFSWWRRVTHENVDLNRNWLDFSQPLPRNTAYDDLAHLLLPTHWPAEPWVEAALADYVGRHGLRALQTALTAGQYHHPEGLFFGGQGPTWSQQTLRHVLQEHGQRCTRLAWVDLHTGLGPAGHGELIAACRDEPAALARAHAWWGTEVTSIYDGSSTSARLSGLMFEAAYQECPQAEYTGIALEYGTVPLADITTALREDQWFELHPEADPASRAAARRRMRDAFYTDTDDWKQRIVDQARQAAQQALSGLSGVAGEAGPSGTSGGQDLSAPAGQASGADPSTS